MNISRLVVWVGILAFIGSFFLTAVRDATNGSGFTGYWCALTALTAPWGSDGLKEMHQDPIDFFSVLFSGWINPLFLITLAVRWRHPQGKFGWILGILVLILLPSCWVVFAKAHLRPSIGYFVWTAAIVGTLFAGAFARAHKEKERGVGRPA